MTAFMGPNGQISTMPPSPAMGFPTGGIGNQNTGGTTYGGKPLSAWGGTIPLGLPFGGGQLQSTSPQTAPTGTTGNPQSGSGGGTMGSPNSNGLYGAGYGATSPSVPQSPTTPQSTQSNPQQPQGPWQQQAQALPGMNPQIMAWLTQMMQGQQGGGGAQPMQF